METEIELKLFVSSDFLHVIQDKIANLNVLKKRKRDLVNIYYDTPCFLLRQHDIGLRVRQYEDVFVQTLKTQGRVVAGLHQRPEYNSERDSLIPDLSLIPHDAWPVWPAGINIDEIGERLSPLFSTNFNRQYWLISMPDNSQIELAFDVGEVRCQMENAPISEIELELKSGQIDALFSLARELAQGGGLRLGNLSKAATGYRLATNYQGDLVKPLNVVELTRQMNTEQGFIQSLEHALAHWLYHEQIYVERADKRAINEICNGVALVRQVLALYGGLIPRRASALLRQELQWLEGALTWIHEAQSIERLCDEKGYFLRKLNAQKQLCLKLDEKLNAFPTQAHVFELLHSSRYCNLLLSLNCWIITRGWQPFLDEKSREKLSISVFDFANKALSHSWNDVTNVFSMEHEMDRVAYLDQQPRLMRSLLTASCLGSLFDKETSETFSLPWLDCLQGIDDILLLNPVRALLAQGDISEENKEQMKKWLRRKDESLLHAMTKSRETGLTLEPYWKQ